MLSIVHEGTSTGGGGLFEDLVEQRGDRLERWVTVNGLPGPDAAASYDAIMVFGGAMHPDQDAEHPWLADETAFLREALAAEVPLLGVCLGSQLIARAAGAVVGPVETAEVGWHEVALNDAGRLDPVLGVLPDRVSAFQWHYYTFELPSRGRAARGEHLGPAGVPARRPDVGDPVPRGGDAAHARPLVRRGRGRSPEAR